MSAMNSGKITCLTLDNFQKVSGYEIVRVVVERLLMQDL